MSQPLQLLLLSSLGGLLTVPFNIFLLLWSWSAVATVVSPKFADRTPFVVPFTAWLASTVALASILAAAALLLRPRPSDHRRTFLLGIAAVYVVGWWLFSIWVIIEWSRSGASL